MNKKQFKDAIAYLTSEDIRLTGTEIWDNKPWSVELETYTEAGEDMIINLEEPTKECLQEYVDNFDVDEQVDLWWQGGRPGNGLPFTCKEDHYADYRDYLATLRDVIARWPEKGKKSKPAMQDKVLIAELETTYQNAARKMRPLLLASIKEALIRLSPKKHELILTDYNKANGYEAVYVCVETDRHTGDMGFQEIDSIGAKEEAFFEVVTQDGYATGEMLPLDELLSIWHFLDTVTDDLSSRKPEFRITDGRLGFINEL